MLMKGTTLLFIAILCIWQTSIAQNYTIDALITSQPEEYILLEVVNGDDFSIIDSAMAQSGNVHFELSKDAHAGIYRLVFGKTGYAKVMNTDPQMLDFIFNDENIQLKTDFKNPLQTVQVIQSTENKVYFDFLVRLKEYKDQLRIIELESDTYWANRDSAKALNASNEFNRLQLDWDLRTAQTIQQSSSLYASKLMELKRTPIRDAFLTPEERDSNYRKEFLQRVDFDDESLIYSSAYTDKIFEFLTLFNQAGFNRQQRTAAYIEAVDNLFFKMNNNENVDQFIIDYLLHGFHVLGMKEVIDHINKKTK